MKTNLLKVIMAIAISGTIPCQSQNFIDSINSYVVSHKFNGSILIRQSEENLFSESYGLANLPFRVGNTNDTKYKIASITKLFTSVLIMRLFEEGKLELDATIGKYYPGYPGEGVNLITIHHLLNHTSGLPYFGPSSKEEALDVGMVELQLPHTLDSLITKYHSQDLVHEPGKVFNYNNGDYLILGKIIEMIEGRNFGEVLQTEILDPLQMVSSGLLYQYQIIENLADSYFTMNDSIGLVHDLPVYIQNWYTAGAMYSTIYDLQKFSSALFSQQLISQNSLEKLLTPGLDGYGYGLWIYDLTSKARKYRVYKRPGDIMGSKAMLVHLPEKDLTIIMLTNNDLVSLDDFVREIMIWIIESQG